MAGREGETSGPEAAPSKFDTRTYQPMTDATDTDKTGNSTLGGGAVRRWGERGRRPGPKSAMVKEIDPCSRSSRPSAVSAHASCLMISAASHRFLLVVSAAVSTHGSWLMIRAVSRGFLLVFGAWPSVVSAHGWWLMIGAASRGFHLVVVPALALEGGATSCRRAHDSRHTPWIPSGSRCLPLHSLDRA